MSKSFNENSRVKIPALLHLVRLGYKFVSVRQIERQLDGETNIYKKSFRAALNKINTLALAAGDVDFIIGDIANFLAAADLGRGFYEKFFTGIAFAG